MWTEVEIPRRGLYRWRWIQDRFEESASRKGSATADWIDVEMWNPHLDQWRPVRSQAILIMVAKKVRVRPPIRDGRRHVVEQN